MKARRSSCIKETSTKNTQVYCIYLGLPLNVLFDLTILRHFTIHILNSLLYGKQIHHKPSKTSVNTSDIKISEWCYLNQKWIKCCLVTRKDCKGLWDTCEM